MISTHLSSVSFEDKKKMQDDVDELKGYLENRPFVVKGGNDASDAAFAAAYDLETTVRKDSAPGSLAENQATDLATALVAAENNGGSTADLEKALKQLEKTLEKGGLIPGTSKSGLETHHHLEKLTLNK